MVFRKMILMLMGILLSVSCSGEQEKEVENNQMMNNSKVLIVFFSHAGENFSVGNVKVGNTKRTGGDEFEIVAEKSYDMPYSQLIEIAKEETKRGEKPAFKGEVKNIEQYDTIFIGGPIWWGTYPQVVFTFFDKYDLDCKTIIPFTTHEGSGLANTVADVKRAYPKAKVMEGFAVYGHEVRKDMSKVNSWLNSLGY